MKKTLALVLAIVMALGCMSITAFAETPNNAAEITAEITAADFGYEMVIPTATTLTEANHENVLLGTDGKVSIKDIKHPTDKVNVVYTVDLSNGNLTDGTTTINATYKYKQGANEFAAIDGTTKVTVYANKTVTDSFVNVTANKDQWNAAPVGTYNASVTFNFAKEELFAVTFSAENGKLTDSEGQTVTSVSVPSGTTYTTSANTVTIGGKTYTAVPDDGYKFSAFNPASGTVTGAMTITVTFAEKTAYEKLADCLYAVNESEDVLFCGPEEPVGPVVSFLICSNGYIYIESTTNLPSFMVDPPYVNPRYSCEDVTENSDGNFELVSLSGDHVKLTFIINNNKVEKIIGSESPNGYFDGEYRKC